MISTCRDSPEPPVGPREYLLDPPGFSYGAEESGDQSELALREEEDSVEEESSLLQEVLSSLKTPLMSCSLGVETEEAVLTMEGPVKEKEQEEAEIEEGEEIKEEEAEANEDVGSQAAPSGSLLIGHTTEEEEDIVTVSCEEEEVPDEEEKVEEEEETAAGRVSQHDVCIFDLSG